MAAILRKKILVVDDDFINVALLKRYVLNAGFDVNAVYNGKEALEEIQQDVPDLILLDSVMPEMNGFELCRQIREDGRLKGIPIIMVTGLNTESESVQGRMSGANEFLVKPVAEKDLTERIRSYLHTPFK